MCGFVGVVAPPGRRPVVSRETLLSMRDTMTDRGPDDAGLYIERNLAFAHRRLAIRDLDEGRQPMVSDDGRYVLVYNGELYNDAELRRELIAHGVTFRTKCDTETLLTAYMRWGDACLEKLRGMFAFAVYDLKQQRLFAARDRLGVKPFFHTQAGDEFLFGSTIASLLPHPKVQPKPNWPALSHYLTTLRLTLGHQTCFDGIEQLEPGEALTWKSGRLEKLRYWSLPTTSAVGIDFPQSVELLHNGLWDAVRTRLVSDVKVGAFLSGGVDSNTITSLMAEELPQPLATQSVSSQHADDVDAITATRFAKTRGFAHEDCEVSADRFRETWEMMVERAASPLATPSDPLIFHLAQRMKQRVGVVLGGEGADELLCGYEVACWSAHDYDRWMQPGDSSPQFRTNFQLAYGSQAVTHPLNLYFKQHSLIDRGVQSILLTPHVNAEISTGLAVETVYRQAWDSIDSEQTIERMSLLLQRFNLESLLARLDQSTMFASLEARVPFTDHQLYELVRAIPFSHRIRIKAGDDDTTNMTADHLFRRQAFDSKKILRAMASRYMDPEFAQRRKGSFSTGVPYWLPRDWAPWCRETLLQSEFISEHFQHDMIRELVDHPRQSGMWLWPLMNLAMWGDRVF